MHNWRNVVPYAQSTWKQRFPVFKLICHKKNLSVFPVAAVCILKEEEMNPCHMIFSWVFVTALLASRMFPC